MVPPTSSASKSRSVKVLLRFAFHRLKQQCKEKRRTVAAIGAIVGEDDVHFVVVRRVIVGRRAAIEHFPARPSATVLSVVEKKMAECTLEEGTAPEFQIVFGRFLNGFWSVSDCVRIVFVRFYDHVFVLFGVLDLWSPDMPQSKKVERNPG